MYRVVRLFALLVVFASTGVVFGDGVMIPLKANAKVDIPDQEALIHWADGVETLIIQTSFTGEGDAFAWIIPTPSKPEVTASTTGLFPMLRTLTAPEMRHPQRIWAVWVWLVVLSIGGCVSGRGREVLLILVSLFLVMSILMPSLGAAGGGSVVAGLRVHERGVVGGYEVAVLSADDPESLVPWLDDNGFQVSAETGAAIRAYVSDGWFFTAAKLVRDAAKDGKSATHPLALRFQADQPVYPLRLTATGSLALAVDLYVFGPLRAAAPGFEVIFCDRLAFPESLTKDEWSRPWSGEGVPIFHPELRSRIVPAEFVTKLSANLSPADMARDAVIQWDGEKTYVPTQWTFSGARVLAINVGLTGMAMTVLVMFLVVPKDKLLRRVKGKAVRHVLVGAIAWAVLSGIVYLALPKAEADIVRISRRHWQSLAGSFVNLRTLAEQEPEVLDATQDTQNWLDELGPWLFNPVTRKPIRAEDSPGNITIERTDEGLLLTAYGPYGAPLRIDPRQLEQE